MSSLKYVDRFSVLIKNAFEGNPRLNDDHRYEFKNRWAKPLFYSTAATFLVAIAIVSIATAGYQFAPIVTTSWIDTNTFWFNNFIPNSYRPQTRICGGHAFRIGDSNPH